MDSLAVPVVVFEIVAAQKLTVSNWYVGKNKVVGNRAQKHTQIMTERRTGIPALFSL